MKDPKGSLIRLRLSRRELLKSAAGSAVALALVEVAEETSHGGPAHRVELLRLHLRSGAVLSFPDPRFYGSLWLGVDGAPDPAVMAAGALADHSFTAVAGSDGPLVSSHAAFHPTFALIPEPPTAALPPPSVLGFFRSQVPFFTPRDLVSIVVIEQELLPPLVATRTSRRGDQFQVFRDLRLRWQFRTGYHLPAGGFGIILPPWTNREAAERWELPLRCAAGSAPGHPATLICSGPVVLQSPVDADPLLVEAERFTAVACVPNGQCGRPGRGESTLRLASRAAPAHWKITGTIQGLDVAWAGGRPEDAGVAALEETGRFYQA